MQKDMFEKMDHPLDKDRPLRFNGSDYEKKHDQARLTGQLKRVFDCMQSGVFRTLDEISQITGDPQASISAQLRHLRKERFGSYKIEKQNRGDRSHGLYEYRLVPKETIKID